MTITRREFLFICALPLAACRGQGSEVVAPAWINIGQASELKSGWNRYPLERVAIFKADSGELSAVSLLCTHQTCLLDQGTEGGFVCPCHGSTFSATGAVQSGPATKDLPKYTVSVNEVGEIRVALGKV